MNMLQYLVIIGSALQFYGIAVYAKDTVRGTTKPNRVTWLLWAAATLIAAVAAFADGVRWAVLPAFASGIGSLIVFFASFVNKEAYWRLQKFDYFCGAFSVLALFFWYSTKDPLAAIFLAIISDFLASIPTLAKAWKYPETESVTPYVTGLLNLLTPFFAIEKWAAAEYAFPLYCVLMGLALLFAVVRKRPVSKKIRFAFLKLIK